LQGTEYILNTNLNPTEIATYLDLKISFVKNLHQRIKRNYQILPIKTTTKKKTAN